MASYINIPQLVIWWSFYALLLSLLMRIKENNSQKTINRPGINNSRGTERTKRKEKRSVKKRKELKRNRLMTCGRCDVAPPVE